MQLHILEASSSFATRRHSTSSEPHPWQRASAPRPRTLGTSKLPHASANLSSVLQASPPTPRPHMPRPHLGDTPSAHTPFRTRPLPHAYTLAARSRHAGPLAPHRRHLAAPRPALLAPFRGVFVPCLLSAHMPRPHLGDAPSAHTPLPARGHFRNAYTLADLVAHAVGTPAR